MFTDQEIQLSSLLLIYHEPMERNLDWEKRSQMTECLTRICAIDQQLKWCQDLTRIIKKNGKCIK